MKQEVSTIMSGRMCACAIDDNDIRITTLIEHRIETGHSTTQRQIPYRMMFIEEEVQGFLSLNVISVADPAACPCASRIVVVLKKDGRLRICVDKRQLKKTAREISIP